VTRFHARGRQARSDGIAQVADLSTSRERTNSPSGSGQ
jgi:hypothetical protein